VSCYNHPVFIWAYHTSRSVEGHVSVHSLIVLPTLRLTCFYCRVVGVTPKRIVVVRWIQRDEIDTERLHGVQDFTHQTQGRWIVYVFRLGKGVGRPMIRTSVTDGGWKDGVYYRI